MTRSPSSLLLSRAAWSASAAAALVTLGALWRGWWPIAAWGAVSCACSRAAARWIEEHLE